MFIIIIIIMSGQFLALAASSIGKELLMYIEWEAVG
jgi:hypothetical protein